jgi:hypothetical protein
MRNRWGTQSKQAAFSNESSNEKTAHDLHICNVGGTGIEPVTLHCKCRSA